MKILVTGGAGFIGRWVTKKLLDDGHEVVVLDNFSNGRPENIKGLKDNTGFIQFIEGDIKDNVLIMNLFKEHRFTLCYHLAASINVQDSIDNPRGTFENDAVGTFNVLEQCRLYSCKMIYMSTCMVYDRADENQSSGIDEEHPVKVASP